MNAILGPSFMLSPHSGIVGEIFLYGRIVGGNGIAHFPECAQKYIDAVRVEVAEPPLAFFVSR
jgi:hypothetical protein